MAERPNILLIYTDQQRADTIHALGAHWMVTPNLDRLCEEGTAFVNATTPSPVCMPARWSLHTGQWPSRHRCYSNHHPGPRPSFSLPALLRGRGYRTALIGKNHSFLGPADWDVFDTAPERSALRQPGSGVARSERSDAENSDAQALAARRDALSDPIYGRLYPAGAPGGLRGDPELYKTEAALRFIDDSKEEPFFLWLSYLNPHTPYVAVQQFLDLYANREIPEPVVEPAGLAAAGKPFRQVFHQRNNDAVMPFDHDTVMQMRRVYYAMVSLIDSEVGRISDHLDQLGLTDRTFIIFTSDHGDYMGDHGLITKSPALYDCLVRVPFIVRQPGVIADGERRCDLVSHIDILPTLVHLAGGAVPDGVQGKDFLDRRGLELRPAAYCEYGIPGLPYDQWAIEQAGYSGQTFTNPGDDRLPWEGNPVSLSGPIGMIRTDRWKLIQEPGGTDELYDLENDPHELVNLAGQPQVSSELRALKSILDHTNASR